MDEHTNQTSKHGITEEEVQKTESSEASETNNAENSSPRTIPEVQSLSTLLFSEQYAALRNEIEKRIEIRQQILALTLLVAGTFLTVGVQPNVSVVVLLFYPILAMFLGAIWEHNDVRVGQINYFIRTQIEKHLDSLGPGWETFRSQTFIHRQHNGKMTERGHPLTPQPGLILFATRGMFLTTQSMAIMIATVRYIFELLQTEPSINLIDPKQLGMIFAIGVLFSIDVAVIIYTYFLVRHKRT